MQSAILLVVLCVTVLGNTPVLAQTTPSVGQDLFNTQNQLQNLDPTKNKETTDLIPQVDDNEEPTVDTDEATQEDMGADKEGDTQTKFTLTELVVTGVTAVSGEVLTEKFTPWIGKEVDFNDLLKVAADITEVYKKQGYVTSRAVVPPQEVKNGSVRIHVIEGKVGDVTIKGNKFVREKFIAARVNVKPGDVFKIESLEKDLIGLNDRQFVDRVHANLQPGEEYGSSDIVLQVKDHRPYHLQYSFDNFGRDAVGLYRNSITVNHENLLGVGDTFLANMTLNKRTNALFTQYRYPLNQSGSWGVTGNYIYSKANVRDKVLGVKNNQLALLKISSRTHRFGVATDFPIYKPAIPKRYTVTGDVTVNWTDTELTIGGLDLKEYQQTLGQKPFAPIVYTLTSGVNATRLDRKGRTVVRGSMTNGIGWMGGNTAFTKWNVNATRIQTGLPFGLVGLIRAQGQLAAGRLPGVEQMQLGGNTSVRGFTEGLLTGDAGYLVSGELRFPLYGTPKIIRNNWQGLLFVDHGGVFITGSDNHPRASGTPGYLTSYGIGLRGKLTQYLQAQSDLGFIWQHDQPNIRAHFKLTSQLF